MLQLLLLTLLLSWFPLLLLLLFCRFSGCQGRQRTHILTSSVLCLPAMLSSYGVPCNACGKCSGRPSASLSICIRRCALFLSPSCCGDQPEVFFFCLTEFDFVFEEEGKEAFMTCTCSHDPPLRLSLSLSRVGIFRWFLLQEDDRRWSFVWNLCFLPFRFLLFDEVL